jgi:hypothetical protein
MREHRSGAESNADSDFDDNCAEVRRLLARADLDEVATRYQIGVVVVRVRDKAGRSHERAVKRLATGVNRSVATLYRYAMVVDAWPPSEFIALCARTNREGEPLSWSHWVELVRMSRAWRPWLERTLKEAWSARRLAEEITAAQDGVSGDVAEAADTTSAALAMTLRGLQRFGGEFANGFEAVLDRIERAPTKERAKDVPELLARALALVEDAHQKTGILAARVRRLAARQQN